MQALAYYIPITAKYHRLAAGRQLRAYTSGRRALLYVTSGEGSVCIDDVEYLLAPGTCIRLQPHSRVRWLASASGPVFAYYVTYGSYLIDPADNRMRSGSPEPGAERCSRIAIRSERRAELEALAGGLLRRPARGDVLAELKHQTALPELLHLVETELRSVEAGTEANVQRTIDYMNDHYMEAVKLGELPDLAGLTPSSYCRAFKRLTGTTPGGYLSRLRMEKAKLLLGRPGATLKEVARIVGFQDELYFSRVFKKAEGVSPSGYRRQNRQRIAIVSHLFLQDHLLSLGVTPLAAPSFPSTFGGRGFPSFLKDGLRGTVALNAERHISPVQVASLEPDVIIKMSFRNNPNDGQWDQAADQVYYYGFPNWDGYLRDMATMIGKEGEAEALERRIARLERTARDELIGASRRGRWAIVRVLEDDFRLYVGGGHAFTDLFYRKLGFQPSVLEENGSYVSDGLTRLARLDPDRILVLWSEATALARLNDNPAWRELRAVECGQVYVPDSVEWDAWGPAGREFTLDKCVQYFKGIAE